MLILTQRWHGRLSLDHDLTGAQKLHATPVPRIGGVGLLSGLGIAITISHLTSNGTDPVSLLLLLSSMPVFLAGLAEDLTKKISVRTRLLASFASAASAIWLLNARLLSLDTPVLDTLVSHPTISVMFTMFAVAGVTQSINIIDGLNGLAAGTVSIMLGGLATLAWMHGDLLVMKLCLWGIAAIGGFLLLNYPFGRIFLGDGGAYLAGFWLAECAVLLLMRVPSVSTWAVLLACFYPVWETIFSMYRRHVVQRVNSGQPDLAHLHQLLFQNIKINQFMQSRWARHGLSTATIWTMAAACQVAAISFSSSSALLFCGVVVFAATYSFIYLLLAPKALPRQQQIHIAEA